MGPAIPMGIWETPIIFSQLRLPVIFWSKEKDPIFLRLTFKYFSRALLLSETVLDPRKFIG
jgi:hypothetical protein